MQMERKPKRLRPWLESLINNREIPGLQWDDEEHTLFRIPWKHRGKHDWSPENSRIFMEWAKQTGRYREGIDLPDYPAWKTRLRCAFNKAPDIEEVKERSNLDCAYPYRVYRLKPVPKIECQRLQVMRSHPAAPRVNKPYSKENSRSHRSSCQEAPSWPRSPPVIKTESGVSVNCPVVNGWYDGCSPHHLNEEGAYFVNGGHYVVPHQDPSSMVAPQGGNGFRSSGGNAVFHSQVKMKVESPLDHSTPIQNHVENNCEMVIRMMYCGKEVLERVVRSPGGCRISYGNCPLPPFGQLDALTDFVENIYGPSQTETIVFPPCLGHMTNEKHEKLGQELLERGLRRGIVVTCQDNNIYAYRLCQSAVFYSSQLGTDGKPVKLRRAEVCKRETTKLFDYRDQYIPALKDYLDGLGDKPDPRCYLVFGQEVSMLNLNSSVLIVVSVVTQAALNDLEKAEAQMSIRTPKVEVSNSTELDHLARTLMSLCEAPGSAASHPNLAVQYSPTETIPTSSDQTPWYQSACALADHSLHQTSEVNGRSEDMETDPDPSHHTIYKG